MRFEHRPGKLYGQLFERADMRPAAEHPMTHVADLLGFTACWLGGPVLGVEAFAARVAEVLRQFRELDPVFGSLHWLGKSRADSPPLAPDLGDVPEQILRRASRGSWGFAIDFDNLETDSRHLQIAVSGGSAAGGGCTVQVPAACVSMLGSRASFRALINAVAAAWPVHYAFTTTRAWDEAVNPWPASRDMMPIGGLTFSDKPGISVAMPDGISHEPLGSGTIIAITERPDLLRADEVRQAMAVRDILEAKGLLALKKPSGEGDILEQR